MTLGDKIKERRKYLHLKVADLAELIGVSPSGYYKYETGQVKLTDPDKIKKLADALGVTEDYLREETGEDDSVFLTVKVRRSGKGDEVGYIAVPSSWTTQNRHYVAIRLDDDRMAPDCPKGGTVLVKLQDSLGFEDGQLIAVTAKCSGKIDIGRGFWINDIIAVAPLNSKWPLEWHRKSEVESVGLVVETRRYWE